jgi:hypothetical protein
VFCDVRQIAREITTTKQMSCFIYVGFSAAYGTWCQMGGLCEFKVYGQKLQRRNLRYCLSIYMAVLRRIIIISSEQLTSGPKIQHGTS